MTFHDLKLPKELAKKKKLELFKCWILNPLEKTDPTRVLELNTFKDRFGLTEQAAFYLAINQMGIDAFTASSILDNQCIVIGKFTLASGAMNEEVIVPPENDIGLNLDPQYDPVIGVLSATIHNRLADTEIKNYHAKDVYVDVQDGVIEVKRFELEEQIINTAVTGGK